MKNHETKPLKNTEKYEDGLLEVLIANKQLILQAIKLEPSKSYRRKS
jgi:hypothetical protein